MSKFSDAPFHETKVFTINEPGGVEPLLDENGDPFTVEFWAPQSARMQKYDKAATNRYLIEHAKSNKAFQNADVATRNAAKRLVHAIKAWHPVSPEGQFIPGLDPTPEMEPLIVDELCSPITQRWLTRQMLEVYKEEDFFLTKDERMKANLEKKASETKKSEVA